MSHIYAFVVGQNFGPFVNNDIWNLVRWRLDKLVVLGCIFSRDVSLVGDPSSFVFCKFFDKLFGHFESVLYCGMSSLSYFPNLRWYRLLQCFAVIKFYEKVCVTPSQFQESVCLCHTFSSYLIF